MPGTSRRRLQRGISPLAPIAAVLILAACGGGHRAAARAPDPTTHTVTVEAMRFSPERLTVKPGDIVVWINKDLVPHTATAKGGFDSGNVDPGRQWRWTVKGDGRIDYVCTYHPGMKGSLAVRP